METARARPTRGSFCGDDVKWPGWASVVATSDELRENPAPCRLRDGGGARGHIQLAQNVREVTMDGVIADEKALGDRLVVETFGDQAQHLDLTFGEAGSIGASRRC